MKNTRPENLETSLFSIGLTRVLCLLGAVILLRFDLWFAAMVLIVILALTEVCRWWSRGGLVRLEVEEDLNPQRLFAGEETSLRVTLHNRKLCPVILEWSRALPSDIGWVHHTGQSIEPRFSAVLKWFGSQRAEFRLKAARRGYYEMTDYQITSSDGIGFFSTRSTIDAPLRLIVYPALRPLPELGIEAADLIGEKTDKRYILPDPVRVVGVRPYTPDMPARLINWKASASKDALMAHIIEPSADYRICIAIDAGGFDLEGDGPDLFEQALSIAASIAVWADEEGIPAGLVINAAQKGLPGPVSVPVNAKSSQTVIIMEKLARAELMPLGLLAELLDAETVPWGTSLVMIGPTTLGVLAEGGQGRVVSIPLVSGQRSVEHG